MDCEKFDEVVIDALYDELDEVTSAALRRHVESCGRCAAACNGLRGTRDVAVLPLEEPSDDLEARILAAATAAQQTVPLHRRALRALAWAGSQAMRPQLAAAAVLVLILGSSVLLLRPKPGTLAAGPVQVTERGTPAPDVGDAPVAAAEPTPAATAAPAATADAFGSPPPPAAVALAERSSGGARAAEGPADNAALDHGKDDQATGKESKKKGGDASSALADARAVKASSGCAAAVTAFDDVGARYPGTAAAADAMWEEAECYRAMGQNAKARDLFLALRGNASYRDRAAAELGQDAASQNAVAAQAGAGMAAPAAAAPRAAAPAKAAAKPAQEPARPNAAPARVDSAF